MAFNLRWITQNMRISPLSRHYGTSSLKNAKYPSFVKIVEVGARDGLQNEKTFVPTDAKVKLIDMLSKSGLGVIEATAFVSPKWVPQMKDNVEVMKRIQKSSNVSYPVLVPNLKGMEAAVEAGAKEIALFYSVSESFSQKNTNCSIDEMFKKNEPLVTRAKELGLKLRGYVSCALGCPYEGKIDPTSVGDIALKLYNLGCYEISLADTIGVGNPESTRRLIRIAKEKIPVEHLAVHFHNTYGQALVNILVALEEGVSVVDSSVAGLGGCPYARGATGNVATEDVLYMLHGMGIQTGVDIDQVIDSGKYICDVLGTTNNSNAAKALLNKRSP